MVAGDCAGGPSTWTFASGSTPSIGICEWFVDPAHFGKGIGKRMVQHFSAPGKFLYTFVISEAAIANFKRLGWVGPHIAPMLARPLPALFAFPAWHRNRAPRLHRQRARYASGTWRGSRSH